MLSYWWFPTLILSIFIAAYLSKINNDSHSWKIMIALWLYGAIFQLWPWVSKYSKRLLFDAMLYDITMFVSYTAFIIFFMGAGKFNYIQYIGVSVVIIGFIIMKLGE